MLPLLKLSLHQLLMEIVPFKPFQPTDRISNLRQDIIDKILMILPIRDAVRTSILSKRWRYKWVGLRQLIFDDTFWQESNAVEASEGNGELAARKIVDILVNVLSLHRGPLTKFSLVIPQLQGWPVVSYFIEFLSTYDIEELTFEIENNEYYLPSSIFLYSKLIYLKLSSCGIDLPLTFQGFKRLVRLELHYIILYNDEVERFVSSCPLLEYLVLYVSNEAHLLEFSVPRLKVFETYCNADYIRFKNSPLLAKVSIERYYAVEDSKDVEGTVKLIEFLNSVPALEELSMGVEFLKNLAAGQVQKKLPAKLIHLRVINLSEICLDFLDELSSVLCLIRSSPNLEKLQLEIWKTTTAGARVCNFLKAQDYSDVVLNRLEEVKLLSISGTFPEMELIKLLLMKSLKLKKMVISLWMQGVADGGVGILTYLNTFKRASPEAKVIFEF